MKNLDKPSILVIDDESEELAPKVALRLNDRAKAYVIHPQYMNF